MPERSLEGQRAIVTGGSSGIGAAIALKFADHGASVWAAGGRDEAGLQRTIEACARSGVKASGGCCDLSRAGRAADIVREGVEFLGGLDILVNCAGTRCHKDFLEFTDDEVDLLFEVNAKAAFIASREAARVMVPQGGGRILMIGSIHGEIGMPGNALYCTTKASMHNLTRALAVELGPSGVRVNCLIPGTTLSGRVQKIHDARPGYAESKLPRIPVRRFAEAEEMADLAAFMVSKENDFMNGALVTSDGGTTAM
ncbi:MAG: SDR family NAD(P)-dependent oxidoreductase [bacterium]